MPPNNSIQLPALRAAADVRRSTARHVATAQKIDGINTAFILACVIRSIADSETERFYTTGRSRRFPPEIRRRAAMRLTQIEAATRIEDLRLPPSNRLEALKGDRKGQWSIRINDQWRVCFRFVKGDAYDVRIVDYH